ncbi:MAG: tetratricopeptide repeat protein [Nitrospirota bacterium]
MNIFSRDIAAVFLFREEKREQYFGLLIAAIAFLVYANSTGNGFVSDDHSVILNNSVLRAAPVSLFNTIDTTSDTQLSPYYRPLTYLTFLIEERLHGFDPFMMHLFNVLLHAVNAFLVYRLGIALLNDQKAALLAGLLFAVHPVHTEGVNFLSGGRNTMLACFFILAAVLIHRRAVLKSRFQVALFGAALFLAGLFSKEMAMMVLPFILFLEIPNIKEGLSGERLKSALRLSPYAVAAFVYLFMRWQTLSRLGIQRGIVPDFGEQNLNGIYIIPGLAERLLDNIYIVPRYILTIVWPAALSPRYEVPDDFNLYALPLFIGWLSIIAALAWLLRRGRSKTGLFGLSWLALFWLPVSGLFYFSSVTLADRFLYIPAIGLWMIAADHTVRFAPTASSARRYGTIFICVLLLVLASLTVMRNMDWRNDITLTSRLAEQYPENPWGHLHLGSAYIQRRGEHDLELAEKEFEKALALDHTMQSVYTPLGYIKLEKGDFEGAVYYYSEALAIFPFDRDARINRGIAYEKLGRYKEALADYQFYLTIPTYNNVPGSNEYAEKNNGTCAI